MLKRIGIGWVKAKCLFSISVKGHQVDTAANRAGDRKIEYSAAVICLSEILLHFKLEFPRQIFRCFGNFISEISKPSKLGEH